MPCHHPLICDLINVVFVVVVAATSIMNSHRLFSRYRLDKRIEEKRIVVIALEFLRYIYL